MGHFMWCCVCKFFSIVQLFRGRCWAGWRHVKSSEGKVWRGVAGICIYISPLKAGLNYTVLSCGQYFSNLHKNHLCLYHLNIVSLF